MVAMSTIYSLWDSKSKAYDRTWLRQFAHILVKQKLMHDIVW